MKIFGLEIRSSSEDVALREEMSLYKRTLEDIGWINLSQDQYSREELIAGGFNFMLKRCRIMYVNNPLCKHWIQLTTSFVFGRGISVPSSKEKDVQDILTKFWDDADNKKVLTSVGPQRMISNKIQYEGNLFFMLFDDDEGNVRVRILNTVEVADVITDNEDRNKVLFYKVALTNREYNFQSDSYANQKTQYFYIPDIDNETPRDHGVPQNKLKDDCRIFHVKINCDINDKFGIPDLYSGLDWVKAHKDMAGDMATLIKALSQFAWKKKIKGGAAQVNNILARMNAKTNLSNISTMAGKTQIENEGVDMESIDVKTGGVDISASGLKAMQMMVCSASGIFYHYYGDPSTGNLATATSMELPMVKKFEDYQMLWMYIYNVIFMYLFRRKIEVGLLEGSIEYDEKNGYTYIKTNKDLKVDIDFPPIVEQDIQVLANSLKVAKDSGFISDECAARLYLLGLEVEDIDDEVEAAMNDLKEKRTRDQSSFGGGADDGGTTKSNDPAAKIEEAVGRLEKILNMQEAIDVPEKQGNRLARKNNYLTQRMNGYRKALASHFRTFQKNVKDSSKVSGSGDKYVGNVADLDKHLKKLGNGMKLAAKSYFPEAVKIGEKYIHSHLISKKVKVEETLYEKQGDAGKILQKSLDFNSKYIDESLLPAINAKILESVKQPYVDADSFTAAVDGAVTSFEARMEQYVGYLWTVEEKAVKEAGKGTDLKVNFVGPEDEDNCEGCQEGVDGNPWNIDEAPQPGEQQCLGNCRHALQIVDETD